MRHQVAAFVSHRDVHGLTDFLGFFFCRRDHPARVFQSHDGFLSCQLIFSITSAYLRKKKPRKTRKRGKSPTPIQKSAWALRGAVMRPRPYHADRTQTSSPPLYRSPCNLEPPHPT